MTTAVAGTTLNAVVVAVEDAFGNVVTTDTSTVTMTLSGGSFSTGSSSATATAASGVASFANIAINATGTYQLTASDSASLDRLRHVGKSCADYPGALSSLAIQQNPTTGTAGVALAPAVKVEALDQYGNLLTVSSTVVMVTLTTRAQVGRFPTEARR